MMDPKLHFPIEKNAPHSLFGFDLTHYVRDAGASGVAAAEVAERALTHCGILPLEIAETMLGHGDRAVLDVVRRRRDIQAVESLPAGVEGGYSLYVTTLGRLHLRPAGHEPVLYEEEDRVQQIGYAVLDAEARDAVAAREAEILADEAEAFARVRAAMDRAEAEGDMPRVLERVIDHVEHVESVGFFCGDRFLALIDRYVNLIDDKSGTRGYLTALRDRPYARWADDEVLVVAALHALFESGRSVRFEEYNGLHLTARSLVDRLDALHDMYREAGVEVVAEDGVDLFDKAKVIGRQTGCAVGKSWLRYRWIYGLSFMKTERMLPSMESTERADVWIEEFGEDYDALVSDRIDLIRSEHVAMAFLANACVARDVAGVPCDRGSEAASGWVEYMMEKIVGSAVRATGADYGMSSSLRDIDRLVTYDREALVDEIHALSPPHFFTCFVSDDLAARVGAEEANVIASSVQKRMQFNRWHFVPGNLDRPLVRSTRHWYYPPLVPDIAVHSDMHRAAHNRARVKYSIRAPGPDMSRPPLVIGPENYRGFYDVRVVRMEGEPFTTEDILRTRRRTLWLEALWAALAQHAMSPSGPPLAIVGFKPGAYWDMPPLGSETPRAPSRASVDARERQTAEAGD
ncbi:MAG: hypothetical protein RID91_16615 [Azospirillaceae bacterium]